MLKENCQQCIHYELVLNRDHYCCLYGQKFERFTKEERLKIKKMHCFIYDTNKEESRIENKDW